MRVVYDDDCPDCVRHDMGICWTHKIREMRAGSINVSIPKSFKAGETQREIRDEIYRDARASGRDIQRVR